MNRHRTALWLAAVFLTLLMAGCDGYRDKTSFGVEITRDNLFAPATLTVPLGSRVTWKNMGVVPQTATADPDADESLVKLPDGATPWDSGILYPGDMWDHVFDTPGTYVYVSREPKRYYHWPDGNVSIGMITVSGLVGTANANSTEPQAQDSNDAQ